MHEWPDPALVALVVQSTIDVAAGGLRKSALPHAGLEFIDTPYIEKACLERRLCLLDPVSVSSCAELSKLTQGERVAAAGLDNRSKARELIDRALAVAPDDEWLKKHAAAF